MARVERQAATEGLSPLDYHLLLALAGEPLHGYALAEAIAEESEGALEPRAGSLYRVIARLVTVRWVVEVDPPTDAEPNPGLPRRYYALTEAGRRALAAEARRLESAAALAHRRLGAVRGRS